MPTPRRRRRRRRPDRGSPDRPGRAPWAREHVRAISPHVEAAQLVADPTPPRQGLTISEVEEDGLGLGFGLADLARRGRAQASEQLAHGPAAAAVGVLAEELGEPLFAQPRGAEGRGVAGEERERNRRVDVGEDGGGAGPEALEQGAQLIGEREAADGRDRRGRARGRARPGGIVRGRAASGGEAMAIRAEQTARMKCVASGHFCCRRAE